MYIFFFLSIVTLLIAGVTSTIDFLEEKFSFFLPLKDFIQQNFMFFLLTGIVTTIVGIFKLALPIPEDSIPVLGDILPAVTGIFIGISLIINSIEIKNGNITDDVLINDDNKFIAKYKRFTLKYKYVFGFASIIIAVIHLFFGILPVL